MDESKQKALKTAFRIILTHMLEETKDMLSDDNYLVNRFTEELLREVTIRTKVA